MHRGRGRPPNSHKRTLSNLSAASNSAEEGSAAHVMTPGGGSSGVSAGVMSSPLALDLQRSTTSTSIASVVANNAHRAAGVDNALTIVNKASRRVFTTAECDTLEQVRNWAPLTDLERVYQALLRQKISLLERLSILLVLFA